MDARRVILLLLLPILLPPILLPTSVLPSAAGQTYTVTTLADTVAPDGSCSLREAILEAQHETDTDCPGSPSNADDTITIAVSGTIVLSEPLPDIIGRRFVITPDRVDEFRFGALTIRGNPTLTISGDGRHRIITVKDAGSLTLDTLTLTDAVAPDPGGAIRIINADQVTITNSRVTNSTAPRGGAISASNTRVTVERSVVAENRASDRGGAIDVFAGQLIIRDSELSRNTAEYSGGGAFPSQACRRPSLCRRSLPRTRPRPPTAQADKGGRS
ncbi:CSLREA domain-containing protein [Chloroflexus aggregans]|uniref:Polymorphic outer membrane protein n=1 Tax=Chloroflexus aggregans (strain MD-66 / DSM 9485) TaxID=326427 RepID=B8G8C1_CHLAD|nr:CSLREA domain-containing protein [Chloroflexus aggregans]ACL26175.1 polymorphic outer membrane protein [Chloroflexus aggregans DSM 9485]